MLVDYWSIYIYLPISVNANEIKNVTKWKIRYVLIILNCSLSIKKLSCFFTSWVLNKINIIQPSL